MKNPAHIHVPFASLPASLEAKYIITVDYFTMQSEICRRWGPESVDPGFLYPMMGVTRVP